MKLINKLKINLKSNAEYTKTIQDHILNRFLRRGVKAHGSYYSVVLQLPRISISQFLSIVRFLLVTSPTYHNHVLTWISKNSRLLKMEDVTSRYACLGIFGPAGMDLLQKLTLTPLNDFSAHGHEARKNWFSFYMSRISCVVILMLVQIEAGQFSFCDDVF